MDRWIEAEGWQWMNEFYGKQNSLFELYPARFYKLGFGCELEVFMAMLLRTVSAWDMKMHHRVPGWPAFQKNTGNWLPSKVLSYLRRAESFLFCLLKESIIYDLLKFIWNVIIEYLHMANFICSNVHLIAKILLNFDLFTVLL